MAALTLDRSTVFVETHLASGVVVLGLDAILWIQRTVRAGAIGRTGFPVHDSHGGHAKCDVDNRTTLSRNEWRRTTARMVEGRCEGVKGQKQVERRNGTADRSLKMDRRPGGGGSVKVSSMRRDKDYPTMIRPRRRGGQANGPTGPLITSYRQDKLRWWRKATAGQAEQLAVGAHGVECAMGDRRKHWTATARTSETGRSPSGGCVYLLLNAVGVVGQGCRASLGGGHGTVSQVLRRASIRPLAS